MKLRNFKSLFLCLLTISIFGQACETGARYCDPSVKSILEHIQLEKIDELCSCKMVSGSRAAYCRLDLSLSDVENLVNDLQLEVWQQPVLDADNSDFESRQWQIWEMIRGQHNQGCFAELAPKISAETNLKIWWWHRSFGTESNVWSDYMVVIYDEDEQKACLAYNYPYG